MVENDINMIYNSFDFNMKMINFDKYEKYIKMDSKNSDINIESLKTSQTSYNLLKFWLVIIISLCCVCPPQDL